MQILLAGFLLGLGMSLGFVAFVFITDQVELVFNHKEK